MIKDKAKIILVRNLKDGEYDKKEVYDPSEDLILLWMYFDSCVRYDPAEFELIKKLMMQGIVGCNDIGARSVDGKWQFRHDLWDDLKGPHISTDELIGLIEIWYKLVSAKVDKIVISYENGRYSISSE